MGPRRCGGPVVHRCGDEVDDATQCIAAVERGVGALHHFRTSEVDDRQRPEIDLTAVGAERRMPIQQHQHPAAHAAGEAGGTADVHLVGTVERHAGHELERLVDRSHIARQNLAEWQHRHARRRLGTPFGEPARGDDDFLQVERRTMHRVASARFSPAVSVNPGRLSAA